MNEGFEMNEDIKRQRCVEFFTKLSEALSESYEVMQSCNQDISRYLCPNGTISKVTYESKPAMSFRISDHWNWYANTTKCSNPYYIQCYTTDMPWKKKRHAEGLPSTPVKGIAVMIFGKDQKYHTVYGERFNRKTKEWEWIENDISTVVGMI